MRARSIHRTPGDAMNEATDAPRDDLVTLSRDGGPRKRPRADRPPITPDERDAVMGALRERRLRPWRPGPGFVAPLLLVRGAPPARPGVAVVGARASDAYGLACAARVARDVVTHLGRSVISGGAEGCDAAAHRAALEVGGHTVVVLGSGHDYPYPAHHRDLFDAVVEAGGAVVSPFWPTIRPRPYRFLARNQVIAGLAAATVVARAAARSGALSTARAARDLGRPLLAVPSDVGQGLGVGTNTLLAAGARAVTGPGDLAHVLGVASRGRWPVSHAGAPDPWPAALAHDDDLSVARVPECAAVLAALKAHVSLDVAALLLATGHGVEVLVAALCDLEVEGLIERRPGNRYGLRGSARGSLL